MSAVTSALRTGRAVFLLGFTVWLSVRPSAPLLAAGPDAPAPSVGRPAPNFSAPDLTGKQRALTEFQGGPVALFFFCGCPWCTEVAREWGQLQRSGALLAPASVGKPTAAPGAPSEPTTLVVYTLDEKLTRETSASDGLDLPRTVLFSDESLRLSDRFGAHPCPRVFVLDGAGVLRYTNTGPDDAPRKAPALVIVSRALDALRKTGASRFIPVPKHRAE